MIKILLFVFVLALPFVPIMEGKHVVVSAQYMAYACDPACDDFRIITIVGFSPQSMVDKDVSMYFNGIPIQYINKFNIFNQGQVTDVTQSFLRYFCIHSRLMLWNALLTCTQIIY
jgi:hypothetical protein